MVSFYMVPCSRCVLCTALACPSTPCCGALWSLQKHSPQGEAAPASAYTNCGEDPKLHCHSCHCHSVPLRQESQVMNPNISHSHATGLTAGVQFLPGQTLLCSYLAL